MKVYIVEIYSTSDNYSQIDSTWQSRENAVCRAESLTNTARDDYRWMDLYARVFSMDIKDWNGRT